MSNLELVIPQLFKINENITSLLAERVIKLISNLNEKVLKQSIARAAFYNKIK